MHWLVARFGRHFYWRWLCDRQDIALGVPDTPENFPHRHDYVRLNHVYSGSSMYPERSVCQHCGKRMEESGPCLLVWPAR